MKPKYPGYSPTTKRQPKRRYLTVKEIEKRFGLLLLLLQHNFDNVIRRTKVRRK